MTIQALDRRGDLGGWRDALIAFKDQLQTAQFFAAVFDYDGTLVDTKDRLPTHVVPGIGAPPA
jgi:hypothetical protein